MRNGVGVEGGNSSSYLSRNEEVYAKTVTDSDGFYQFENVPSDLKYHITIEHEVGGQKYHAKSLWDVEPI